MREMTVIDQTQRSFWLIDPNSTTHVGEKNKTTEFWEGKRSIIRFNLIDSWVYWAVKLYIVFYCEWNPSMGQK